jgi:hypothetical protein
MTIFKQTEIKNGFDGVYFECDCSSDEHIFKLGWDVEDEADWMWLHVRLRHHYSFWRRFNYAIKYLFGYKSKFGAFEEFLITKDDAKELSVIFKEYSEKQKVIE